MTKLFGVLAAAMLAFVVLAPSAEAHCWWNGYRWHCSYPRHYVGYAYPYPYRHYGYYPYYYRPYYRPYYACVFPYC